MKKVCFLIVIALFLSISKAAFAFPVLQVYIPGAVAGDHGGDEDTWFDVNTPGPFQLNVVGCYDKKITGKGGGPITSITQATLLVTVPHGQSGSISGSGLGSSAFYQVLNFLPSGVHLSHFPLNKSDLYDFYTFDIGSFYNTTTTGLYNYDADGSGSITHDDNATGEERTFTVSSTGYDYLHFDVYAKFMDEYGNFEWRENPGSHDSANVPNVPEPATMVLFSIGALGFGVIRKRKRI